METVDTGTVVGLVIMALAVVIFIYRMSYSQPETAAIAEKSNIDQPAPVAPVVVEAAKVEETMPAAIAEKSNIDQPAPVAPVVVEAAKVEETKTEEVAALEAVLNTPVTGPSETAKIAKAKTPKKIIDKVGVLDVKPKTSTAELKSLDKKALLAKAKELNVAVTARMTKEQLVQKLIKA
jgi:hypothetical protein